MAKLAETIGLSFNDMVDITAWALNLVIFGVFMGRIMYDLWDSFVDLAASLVRLSLVFIRKHFPNVRKRKGETK